VNDTPDRPLPHGFEVSVDEQTAPENLPIVFEVRDLSAFYGDFRAVREVTLDVRKNEITAFIGPSGCGKTTVLRCFNRMNDLIPGARAEGTPARVVEAWTHDLIDGYDVDVAFDGEEMLTKAAASAYDLVLVDIVMPNLDGLVACKRLRAMNGYRDTPFVVLTARTRQDDMAAAFDAGITDYIRKPFALPQVRARVRSWLARGAARRV
jgi:CheY-like chemotaxis protein